jgi:SWI/SNF-related matrix-associated actin-dependent regulator 1 of chromatin subfamily A
MTTLSDLMANNMELPTPEPIKTGWGFTITPVPLALDLFPFQVEAVEHALRDTDITGWGYLALDMGLGKTPCAIAIAAAVKATPGIDQPVLIVVPPSLRINWVREFEKFAPWLTVDTLTGGKPGQLPDVDVLIIGDSTLKAWAPVLAGNVSALIVDEAHRFKNYKSMRSAALSKLAETIPGIKVLMSGTPMPNGRHVELAGQIDILGKGAWNDIGGRGYFWGHFAPKTDAWGGRGNAYSEELHDKLMSTFMIRQRRADVIELPNKGRSGLSVECTGKPAKDYLLAEEDLIAYLHGEGVDTKGYERAEALVKLTTLRKLAGAAKVNGIAEHVKETLSEEPGGVFVVAEHRDVIDGLIVKLAKFNPVVVQGGMTDDQKQEAVDAFCSGQSRVMIGQIIAAGVGLTLHGDGRNHRVVVAQLPWTPADLRQAEDRLHRIGQTHDVEVEVCLAAIEGSWTIDERLWGMLETKHFATGEVLDGAGEFLLEDTQDGILDSYR